MNGWACTKCNEQHIPGTHVTYVETHVGCGGDCYVPTGDRRLANRIIELETKYTRLWDAATALGAMPDGVCFCSKNRSGVRGWHEPECRDLRAALEGK